ncbi:radical SAM family heme chaperone HemW [Aestuariibius sp. HNIBRBA575]|uniref:radical SAM family heme chaperone HemW n=1 Tax=Aestuariibius sp. HNIBRBA575 TaxID=3233343 RepID=UPI0034A5C971
MLEDWQHGGFGLYVHWPFCQSKCPYCDFNSHVSNTVEHADWRAAFVSEIRRTGALTKGRVLRSIFFGGGTPSLMEPGTVRAILDESQKHWSWANDIEITLEANPSSVEANKFADFADAGINRVSLGVQALNNTDLTKLGRLHTHEEALNALEISRAQFNRVSFDLIYGRQDQSLSDWKHELKQALGYRPDHLSLYQLTIEDGTAFGARFAAGKLLGLPNEDLGADMYELTNLLCAENGLQSYEVSNYAQIGSESRHNMIYWTGGDYVGVGPGAHGRLTLDGRRIGTEATRMPNDWLASAQNGCVAHETVEEISAEARRSEFLLMGLRVTDGVDLSRLSELSAGLSDINWAEPIDHGLIEIKDNRVRTTEAGKPLLNAILRQIL